MPYWIAKELIDKVHFCNGCEEIIDIKEESLESHLLQFHDGDGNVSLKPYFGDILLAPGPGHMEKNFLLTIFKFMKDIFMFKLADKLGFRSLKAKDFIIMADCKCCIWWICKSRFMLFYNVVSTKISNQRLKILSPGAIKELLIQILIFTTT